MFYLKIVLKQKPTIQAFQENEEEVSWLQELEISYLQSQREMLYSFVQLASISIIPHYDLDFEGIMGYNST